LTEKRGDMKLPIALVLVLAALLSSSRLLAAERLDQLRARAEKGDASAQADLGIKCATGEGVAKDPAEAVKWFRKAAEQGVAGAQNNLGVADENGVGVLKDEIEALAWFNISAIEGVGGALKNRDTLERKLGVAASLVAQKRSKEIFKEIEANKTAKAASR